MLVLTRKLMERIVIGDDVRITIVRIENGAVRVGIEAPGNVSIVREELIQGATPPPPPPPPRRPERYHPAPLARRGRVDKPHSR